MILLIVAIPAFPQDATHNLSRYTADTLLRSLKNDLPDNIKIESLLKLSQFNILKPGSFKADLDSAALFINQAKIINEKIRSPRYNGYIKLVEAYLYNEQGRRDTGKKYLENAIDILKNTDDKFHLAQAYFELAQFYNYRDHSQAAEKIKLVEQAAGYYQKTDHVELTAYTLKYLADLYNLHGEPLKALQIIKSSLEYYSSIHYNSLQGIYVVFSKIYYRLGDYRKSLDYGIMALKTADRMKDTTMQVCEINNRIGMSLGDLGEFDQAIPYFKDGLNVAMRNKDYDASYELAGNVVQDYIKLNRAGEALSFFKEFNRQVKAPKDEFYDLIINDTYLDIFNKLKMPSMGQPYYSRLLSMDHSPHMTDGIGRHIYPSMIVFYIISKQYSLAKELIIKYQAALDKIEDPIAAALRYNYEFMLDTAMGNYRSAVGNLLKNKNINDSLYTEGKSKQLQNFLAQYDAEKKENEIKIQSQNIRMLNQKNEIQNRNLQQANLIKDVTIGGVFLLSVIAGLVYRQYRLKQKSHIVITHKNELLQHLLTEKEWLLKEVHHRVKNNLHTVICLLESQAAYLKGDALEAIENSEHRIYAMSLIHQKLYQSDDIKTIDMSVYLPEFIRYLDDSFGNRSQVRFQLKIDQLKLGVSQAIPLSLIINEAVTNAIKYAFPGNKAGIITVNMRQMDEQIELVIADNGVGIDTEIANKPSDSLGLKLMKGLSEDINARINFENSHGTRITILFNIDPLINKDNFLATIAEGELA